MLKTLLTTTSLMAATAVHADPCEPLRARIEQQIASAGVQNFSVVAVDVAQDVRGKVVGSCAFGEKKVVYARGHQRVRVQVSSLDELAVTLRTPASTPDDRILTECKDGTVSRGGNCAP
ncbi:MAG: hypothetical protein A2W72_15370 [Burkholderiales bacterium RIFCSPLOWO2_12_67_14]|nr:MAG: hypothetical protein A3I64_23340 [Burkholderiales bacterium RIFCSPLOWO2_02_FULL_67_64]OGB39477.1 MAG: hypothetical protein A2W72_15370 [Burkholderiales bacterium RIFCSPLOWO2_12_67_14]OGB52213.1 MAG: hypothetical protein A3E51_24770 [Burkholderiales bacterium RIFCSPHIGHO2_12_FULL_67_38]